MGCFRQGGCGTYEHYSCNECPANNSKYAERYKENLKSVVVTIEGDIKDNYMAIGKTEEEAKENILKAYFKDVGHTEKELMTEHKCYLVVHEFSEDKPYEVF